MRGDGVEPAPAGPPGLPRVVEAVAAAAGLIAAAPLLGALGLAVRLTSEGPALFRQQRVGLHGRPFTLYKLRTMRAATPGIGVTAGGDPRITPVGRLLRKTKLDELPELWNVAIGEMSFVGARPEVPQYVDLSSPVWRQVLAERPGLTHPVTLRLRNEEELLAGVSGDRSVFYRETLLPWKLAGYLAYQGERSAWRDLRVLFETGLLVVLPSRAEPPTLEEVQRASPPGRAGEAAPGGPGRLAEVG